jgi:hypothetical protein
MKRCFMFVTAVALAATMSTIGWSRSGSSGGGAAALSSFNNPQSRTRVPQRNRQSIGYNVFNDSRIRRELNLSQDQIRQLRALNNSWRQQVQRSRRGAGNNLNSVDQRNQAWLQYATLVNDLLTEEQQQTWSGLIAQLNTASPNTNLGRTNSNISSTPTNSSRHARTVPTGTTGSQAQGGGDSSAVGTVLVNGQTTGTNTPGGTQAQGGGGSSAVGSARVNGQPTQTNRPGRTQAHAGGGSSAVGSARANGDTIVANRPGRTQAQGGGGSSAVGSARVNGQTIVANRPGRTQAHAGGGSSLRGTLRLNAGSSTPP